MMAVRTDEQKLRLAAAVTLGAVMAAHVLLETATDAIFLANVAVETLPIVTIGVAFLALAISRLDGGRAHRRILLTFQLAGAVGTLGFWLLVTRQETWVFYGLYVWSSIVTSLIVVRLWLVLGDLFTIAEGKRFFASIALGGSTGALVGSFLATFASPVIGAQGLLLLAALAYAGSTLGPGFLGSPQTDEERTRSRANARTVSWRESLRALQRDPYAVRISLMIVTAGMALSVGDYLFKSVVAAEVAPEDLAIWLSRVYLGLNLCSIALLAFGVTPLVRRLGIDRSLAILPSLLAMAAIGVLSGAALISTVALKLFDGSLRYSLHKTASELLYLPLPSSLRESVKSAIDLVGVTGAKALASLLVLCLVGLPDATRWVALAMLVLTGAWVAQSLLLRETYLDVFRRTLGEGLIDTMIDHPELDLESAGSLLRALSHPEPARALAALRLLSERGQSDLVPGLILYHPAPRVVEAGLDALTRSGRQDVRDMLDHLIEHEDAGVRAAVVRARWALDRDIDEMRAFDQSECLVIRLSAFAGLFSAGGVSAEEFSRVLDEALAYPEPDARHAAATAARLHYDPIHREPLVALSRDHDEEVARDAVKAIRASQDEWFIPHLVELLGDGVVREYARRTLIEHGRPALTELANRLGCDQTLRKVKAQIPRTIARFECEEAVEALLDGFAKVESGLIRYRLLHALETLLDDRGGRNPRATAFRARADLSPLRSECDRTLGRAGYFLEIERGLAALHAANVDGGKIGGQLLRDLLRDKRALAVGRLFRMLDLLHAQEDFLRIQEGLNAPNAKDRAAAVELVETVLPAESAAALLDVASPEALPAPGARPTDPESLLVRIASDDSETLRAVALYHADELGLEISALAMRETRRDAGAADGGSRWARERDRGLAAIRDIFDRDARMRGAPTG